MLEMEKISQSVASMIEEHWGENLRAYRSIKYVRKLKRKS